MVVLSSINVRRLLWGLVVVVVVDEVEVDVEDVVDWDVEEVVVDVVVVVLDVANDVVVVVVSHPLQVLAQ